MTVTDSAFPFTDEAPAFVEEAEEKDTKRVLVLAGGLVAALALAAGGFLFLTGGEEEVATGEVVRTARPAAAAAPAAAPPAAPKLPVPFEDDLGRDPFRALYVEPAPAAPAPAEGAPTDPTLPGGGTGAGATTGGTAGGTSTGSTGGTGVSAGAPTAPPAPTAEEHDLVLERVYGTGTDLTAEFTIDERKVVAKVGVRFGPTNEIRLISLQQGPKDGQWTAVLQVGDGEPFDAVTGETISVR